MLSSHNPSLRELFEIHPQADKIEILDFGYHGGVEAMLDAAERYRETGKIRNTREYQGDIPSIVSRFSKEEVESIVQNAFSQPLARRTSSVLPIMHGVRPAVKAQIDAMISAARKDDGFVITFGSVAGEINKNIPKENEKWMIETLLGFGHTLAFTGKNFERFGREERNYSEYENVNNSVNFVDKLNLYETIYLIRRSSGLIAAHTATSMIGWYESTPHLLSVGASWNLDFAPTVAGIAGREQWTWGAWLPHNVTVRNEEFMSNKEEILSTFLHKIQKYRV